MMVAPHSPGLRDLITHTFAVRVATSAWKLAYQPGATARDSRPGAGRWCLYLDGASLGDNFGSSRITYTRCRCGHRAEKSPCE
jgi:hypothetical protein